MKAQSIRVTTPKQIDECAAFLKMDIPKQGWRITFQPWKEKRSLDINALQHCIYRDISEYLISKGRPDWTPEYTKSAMKNRFLGWEDREYFDIETSSKKSMQVLRETSKLDKGEAYEFTEKIIAWASSIGLEIKIPARCEYRSLMEEQER